MVTVGVTGHRQLTAEIEKYVRREIAATLDGQDFANFTGITCLADGADTIFAELVHNFGGRLIVVVPAADHRDKLPNDHHATYDRILRSANEIHRLQFEESNSDSQMQASKLLVDKSDQLVAVWDGRPSRGPGGTADVIDYARSNNTPVTVVWPTGVARP